MIFLGIFGFAKKIKPIAIFSRAFPNYKPRGPNQQLYVKYLNDPKVQIVAGVGSAGTGKTLFACETAIRMLKECDPNVQKIILTRPIVSVGEENIGFLPGDIYSKMNPWLLPIFDIFLEYFSQSEIDDKIREESLKFHRLGICVVEHLKIVSS